MSAETGGTRVLDYPDAEALIADCHPHEAATLRVLTAFDDAARPTVQDIAEAIATAAERLDAAQVARAIALLRVKRLGGVPLLEVREDSNPGLEIAERTELGDRALVERPADHRLWQRLKAAADGTASMLELNNDPAFAPGDVPRAIGELRKLGEIEVRDGRVSLVRPESGVGPTEHRYDLLRKLPLRRADCDAKDWELLLAWFQKRNPSKGLVRVYAPRTQRFRLAGHREALGPRLAGYQGQVGQVTPAMLRDGSWKGKSFRRWNIGLTPAAPPVGRRNPYREYLDSVKRKLTSMGFVEMVGNLVETEFWNCDALYMPQFHPAREIHDVYMVKEPAQARELHPATSAAVAAAHERGGDTGSTGWRYHFDLERAKQLILRSHGTALSARTLGSRPPVPSKYFSVARCFRSDTVDATHAADFFQIEGIVLGADINFRHLLGLLRLFGYEVARARECRFVPAYFPFTEPSVEVHMKHPTLGWMELGGSGIFRPELTKPLGIDVPVIAWGLGIDRMAMVALGINDIRDLFHTELSQLRQLRMP